MKKVCIQPEPWRKGLGHRPAKTECALYCKQTQHMVLFMRQSRVWANALLPLKLQEQKEREANKHHHRVTQFYALMLGLGLVLYTKYLLDRQAKRYRHVADTEDATVDRKLSTAVT